MFRPLRRKNQALASEECERILSAGTTGVMAVLGDEGYPYAVPLNYVYKDGVIYLHTATSGHKLDAIKTCNKVSFCVIEQDTVVPHKLTTLFRSVIAFGRARILTDPQEITAACRELGLKYYDNAPAVDKEIARELARMYAIEIVVEHLSGKESIELMRARS